MEDRRVGPLCGVVGVVLIVVSLIVAGSTPNGKASAGTVVHFYENHADSQRAAAILLGLGSLLFLVFAAALASRLRGSGEEQSGASALCLAGAVLLTSGLAVLAGLGVTLPELTGHVPDATLQVLNVFANDAPFVFLITIGTSAFLLGAAARILVTRALPRWLAWTAIVLALVAAVPSHVLGGSLDHIGFVAFGGLCIWTLIVGVLLALRGA